MDESYYTSYSDAEFGVLGSILFDSEYCLNDIICEISEDDFITPEYKEIWRVIVQLHSENLPIEARIIQSRATNAAEKIAKEIAMVAPTAAYYKTYVQELKRHSKMFKAKPIAQEIYNDLALEKNSISEIRKQAEELITVLESEDSRKTDFTMRDMMMDFLNNIDKPIKYLDFGMPTLNEAILAEPGDYILIGATPSIGKTALTLQFAVEMARRGKKVLYFSCEMTQTKITERIISCQARVPYRKIRTRSCTQQEKDMCARASRELNRLPLHVIEAGGMTIEDIRAKIVKYNADVVFIDYIQQISHKNDRLTEYQRTTEISRSIQQLCQKQKIITIALSQFSRLGGQRPTISSFRSSGQLEQDIDVGILFYRPEEVEEGQPDTKRIFEIAKNRNGKIGRIKMFFNGDYQTFTIQDTREG